MSKIKDQAKFFKEISKKYGYEIKHTHALEIISQLEGFPNRHVSLSSEAKEEHYINFSLEKGQEALVVPFFKSHVIEVGLDDDLVVFCVTNSITDLTLLLEDLNDEIVHLKVLKPSDLKREVSFNGEKKSILSWIEKKYEETEDKVFLVG